MQVIPRGFVGWEADVCTACGETIPKTQPVVVVGDTTNLEDVQFLGFYHLHNALCIERAKDDVDTSPGDFFDLARPAKY